MPNLRLFVKYFVFIEKSDLKTDILKKVFCLTYNRVVVAHGYDNRLWTGRLGFNSLSGQILDPRLLS